MKIIWLASYPKTGGTYLSTLISSYFYGIPDQSAEIGNKILDIHMLQAENKFLKGESKSTIFLKGHYLYSESLPYYEHIVGFVYLVRNPRDVLLSSARYIGAFKNKNTLREFAISFIDNLGAPVWRSSNMGTFPENVASWLGATSYLPHLFIKYEELRQSPIQTMEKLVKFFGAEVDQKKIQYVVDQCSIEKAREIEIKEKSQGIVSLYPELPDGEPFVGQGKMGQSLTELGEDIEMRYLQRFGKFINVLGYN